jgi:thiamine biosynthesis lipoprotein
MFDALVSAQAFYEGTSGLFDPAIGAALVALGYDRPFRDGSLDRPENHGVSRFATFGEVTLEAAQRMVHRPSHVTIDLGGLIKGRTVDEAALLLPESGVIDAGGDMAVRGSGPDAQGWLVDVEDPFDASRTLTTLRVHDRAIATSAANRRRWRVGARTAHHLMDPRTQAPAETDLAQVTVLASTAELADVLAKTFFLLGLEGARIALASLPPSVRCSSMCKDMSRSSGASRKQRRPIMRRAMSWGALLGLFLLLLLDAWLSRAGLADSALWRAEGAGPWLVSRSAGLTAYFALTLEVLFGLLVSTGAADALFPRARALEVHQWLSSASLALVLMHALALLGDGFAGLDAIDLAVPFAASLSRFATGLGVISAYLMLMLHVSFAWRGKLGARTWRRLHYVSFALYLGATIHGLVAGTDASSAFAQALYTLSLVSVLSLLLVRIAQAMTKHTQRTSSRAR